MDGLVEFKTYCDQLVAALEGQISPWCCAQYRKLLNDPASADFMVVAKQVEADALLALEELFAVEVFFQTKTPLQVLREVAQVGFAELSSEMQLQPTFELGPVAFAEFGEQVHNAGIAWGAAKAYVFNSRTKG